MFLKYALTASLGFSITLTLFFVMQALIASDRTPDEAVPGEPIEITMGTIETPPERKTYELPPREPTATPPAPPKLTVTETKQPAFTEAFAIGPPITEPIDIGPGSWGPVDGDSMPLVRVEPVYPERAIVRGVEGWVQLAFTISKTGSVEDLRVVDSEPGTIFNRAARRAVNRWKYKPKVVNGVPVRQEGIRVLLTFQLPVLASSSSVDR